MADIDDIDDLGISDVIETDDGESYYLIDDDDHGTPSQDGGSGYHRDDEKKSDSGNKKANGSHYRNDDTIHGDEVAAAVKKADDEISIERDRLIKEANEDFDLRKEAGRLTEEEEAQEEEEIKHYKKNLWDFIKIGVIYLYLLVTIGLTAKLIYNVAGAAITLDGAMVMPKAWYTLWLLFGIFVWVFSTQVKHWNYDIRIKQFFITLIVLFAAELACTFFYLSYKIFLPIVIRDVNPWVSKGDWIFLARIITVVPTLVLTISATIGFAKLVFDPLTFYVLKFFRISNYLDFRKNKKWLYDTRRVICKSSNAKYQIVREMDRFLHSLIIGATGGGKTSSILLPMIDADFRQRLKNDNALKRFVMKMLKKKQAYMSEPVQGDYWIKSIVPGEGYEKKLEKAKNKYRPCGVTIMAPDPSLTDEAYLLGIAKGYKVNRIDPIPSDQYTGKKKSGYIGFNPLYISPDVPDWVRTKEIVKKATLFADVLQSIDDLRGHGDPYFTNLNRCMTVTFIICLEVAYPRLHNGKQPNPAILRDCINNFDNIRPYYRELVKCDKEEKRYSFVTDFISLDIFGPGRDKMLDQVRGLRNLVDLLLATPAFADLLCVDDEHTIDMDKMLSEGQITVVDYAYEEGVTDSTGFGLFFMLSFIDAVLRRPGDERTRIPHFFYLDEASLLVTPRLEQAVSLFRKFRCACTFANQSLVQYERSEQTRTLKGVMISGCSQHYIFGRIGIEEMRTYSELAGIRWTVSETSAVTETSLTTDNPTLSYQTRETLTKDNQVEGTTMRYLPFQELTVFSVRNGNLIPPYFAKVDFLPKTRYNKAKQYEMDWKELYKKYSYKNILPDEKTMKNVEAKIPTDLEEAETVAVGTISVSDDFTDSATVIEEVEEVKAAPSKTEEEKGGKAQGKNIQPQGESSPAPAKTPDPVTNPKSAQSQKKEGDIPKAEVQEDPKPKKEKKPQEEEIGYGTDFGSDGYTY